MHTAIGPWRMRSSGGGAHCDPTLVDEVQRCTLRSGAGEEDWRDTWRRGLVRHLLRGLARHLAKRIGETLGEEKEKKEKEKKEKRNSDKI